MRLHMDDHWQSLTPDNVAAVPATTGVYQIADDDTEVIATDYAGARSRFGLRGALQDWLPRTSEGAARFRYEIHNVYLSRYYELLMLYHAGNPAAADRG